MFGSMSAQMISSVTGSSNDVCVCVGARMDRLLAGGGYKNSCETFENTTQNSNTQMIHIKRDQEDYYITKGSLEFQLNVSRFE